MSLLRRLIRPALERSRPVGIPRCGACRHWEPSGEYGARGWGFCALGEGGFGPRVEGTKAHAYDANGFYSRLYTAPDFGCVQHAPEDG